MDKLNKRPDRPYPGLRYFDKGWQFQKEENQQPLIFINFDFEFLAKLQAGQAYMKKIQFFLSSPSDYLLASPSPAKKVIFTLDHISLLWYKLKLSLQKIGSLERKKEF